MSRNREAFEEGQSDPSPAVAGWVRCAPEHHHPAYLVHVHQDDGSTFERCMVCGWVTRYQPQACSGCLERTIHHTCGREPDAEQTQQRAEYVVLGEPLRGEPDILLKLGTATEYMRLLRIYGGHKLNKCSRTPRGECDCGWDELRDELEKAGDLRNLTAAAYHQAMDFEGSDVEGWQYAARLADVAQAAYKVVDDVQHHNRHLISLRSALRFLDEARGDIDPHP